MLGLALLVGWFALWTHSFIGFQFATLRTWIPVWTYLGLDLMHCVFAVRAMFKGDDPYVVDVGDFRGAFTAPPIVLPLFSWTWFFSAYYATMVWAGVIAATMTWSVELCRRIRAGLGLWVPTMPLATALVLWSMPVLFAMERGNLDVWVLITLYLALPLLRRGGWRAETFAGLILSVGAWAKIYPGLLIFALLPFGRWRTSIVLAVAIVLIGIVPIDATRGFFTNANKIEGANRVAPLRQAMEWLREPTFEPARRLPRIEWYGHSLITNWPVIFGKTPLGSVPGFLGAAALLGPLLLYVSFEVYRSRRRDVLMLPYLLWVVGIGTFGLPFSYDYNLIFFPLVVMCLWSARDKLWLHLMMLTVLVWWQPFAFGTDPRNFLYSKFLAIIPISILLVLRARELEPRGFEPMMDPATRAAAPVNAAAATQT